jgi:hypothetical protein
MRKPGGYAVITSPEPSNVNFDGFRCETVPMGMTERDTYSCCHCGRVVHVKPMVSMDEFGSMCRNCMKMTCPDCASGPCVPFQKRLEEMEHRDRMLRSYGI